MLEEITRRLYRGDAYLRNISWSTRWPRVPRSAQRRPLAEPLIATDERHATRIQGREPRERDGGSIRGLMRGYVKPDALTRDRAISRSSRVFTDAARYPISPVNVRITARLGPRLPATARFRAGRERRTRFRPSVEAVSTYRTRLFCHRESRESRYYESRRGTKLSSVRTLVFGARFLRTSDEVALRVCRWACSTQLSRFC